MINLAVTMLCTAGLFLTLLEDRFRLWVTVGSYAAIYLLSLGLTWLVSGLLGPTWACGAGALLFFLASLFLARNNPLQKGFVAVLSLCGTLYLEVFLPLFLGSLPFSPAGLWGEFLALLGQLLFTAFLGLCLYRPFRHFRDRGPSFFLGGMILLLLAAAAVCHGWVDFLFRVQVPAARLLTASALYLMMIFAFRSVYQAGRFRQQATEEAARASMLEMESGDFVDMLAAIGEVSAARKAGEYALETASVMIQDGNAHLVPAYTASFKENSRRVPALAHYSDNPYLNAVIASKAAFSQQNHIAFESSAVTEGTPLSSVELCVLVNELLTRACLEASRFDGQRKVRFTAFSSEGVLTLEALYSGRLPEKKMFSWKEKKTFADLLRYLFDDTPSAGEPLQGLENSQNILSRYSGKLTVSGAEEEIILHMALHF